MEGENRISRAKYIRMGGIDDSIVPGKATLRLFISSGFKESTCEFLVFT